MKIEERVFMTLDKAADYLGICKSTLYQYTHNRILTHYKPRGKLIYFLKADLDQFIMKDNNRVKSKEQLEEEADSILAKS